MPYKDKATRNARSRARYASDPGYREAVIRQNERWRKAHPQKQLAYVLRWQAKNPAQVRAILPAWRTENQEYIQAYEADYRHRNAEAILIKNARRRASRLQAPVND